MKSTGLLALAGTALVPAWQLAALPATPDPLALFSQYLGLLALILMAWGQIMATRLPVVETLFAGLDRVYIIHKWAGMTAMAALLLHDTIDADMPGTSPNSVVNDIAETLGELSLYGLLILVLLSVMTFLPYHLWKWTHKSMGALFIAGSLHFALISKPFAMGDPAGLFTGVFCALGAVAWAYTVLPEHMKPAASYRITQLQRTGGSLAITMTPDARALKPRPGQFGLFRFTGAGLPEAHPFTFSAIGPDGTLRITVRALGDFTELLDGAVATGQIVHVHGPFGRFLHKARRPAVWVAAGIGITPFVAQAAALRPGDQPVTLMYSVRDRTEAPHLSELEALTAAKDNLTLQVTETSHGRRLNAGDIAREMAALGTGTQLSFCGPVEMRRTLLRTLPAAGICARGMHFEAFEFRTGIGFARLARWLWQRAVDRNAKKPQRPGLRGAGLQRDLGNRFGVVRQRFPAVFGHDDTVADLSTETVRADRAVDGQNHPGLQHGFVSGHKLGRFQKTEARRTTASERIIKASALYDLGIGRMHCFRGHTRAQCIKGCTLTCHRNLIKRDLARVRRLPNPECPVKAQFEAVKIGHATKTQENRFAVLHDPGRGAVMGFGYVFTRGHNLQKMRVRRHIRLGIMCGQQFSRLSCTGLRNGQSDLIFRDPRGNGGAARRHHCIRDLTRVPGHLQFGFGFDHAHV